MAGFNTIFDNMVVACFLGATLHMVTSTAIS